MQEQVVRIGYIGLGAMGGSLARHLVGERELVVYDRDPATLASFETLGARIANTPRELARQCDVVLLCLPRSSDVGDLLFGVDGLAEHLGTGTLVIDQTSGVPSMTTEFARRLDERNVLFLDAPVSGGIAAAQSRSVTIIASGPDAAWERGRTILAELSTKTLRCGRRVGDGQALKLVTNAIGACYRLSTLELVALGRKFGLTLPDIVSDLNEGNGANFTSRNMLVGLVEGRSTTNFAMALMVKDLNGALDLGTGLGAAMPLTATARGLMQSAISLFGQQARLDDVIGLTETLSSVRLAGGGPQMSVALPASLTPADLTGILCRSSAACNVIAVMEGVEIARKFGLPVADIARVIDSGSAWCQIASPLLSAIAAGGLAQRDYEAERQALETAALLAATANLPFIMPATALSRWRDMQASPVAPAQQ
ncbi:NAD(P)-dependent oxidoreductase [Rhizobium ecuadorense]|uniref:NAD(P)-dependent oxidoreductase n=1 Tax=Rhizobium ecuadorense TaxID=1671795 RepID=UPI0031399107